MTISKDFVLEITQTVNKLVREKTTLRRTLRSIRTTLSSVDKDKFKRLIEDINDVLNETK